MALPPTDLLAVIEADRALQEELRALQVHRVEVTSELVTMRGQVARFTNVMTEHVAEILGQTDRH